jgi:hypothetical protein
MFQGLDVSLLLRIKFSRSQGFRVSRLLGFKVFTVQVVRNKSCRVWTFLSF